MKDKKRTALKKYEHCETLPGFAEVKQRLEEQERPSAWIYNVIDTSEPFAMFLRKGKGNYKSSCPHYEGYWLLGGSGSVQCKAADGLLPGLQYSLFCAKNCENCKFYIEARNSNGNKFD
ncbi:MAG: hypothetical protein IJZ42_13075 [Lachnospiraceae bacterium]|nr:hypothetical protein [Lachnospiraceae bacterium]